MDYLRPYSLAHPVQSFTVLEQAPEPEYGYEDTFPTAEGEYMILLQASMTPEVVFPPHYIVVPCCCVLLRLLLS